MLTSDKLYELLDKAKVDYEVVEVFEGLRTINVQVQESTDDEDECNDEDAYKGMADLYEDLCEKLWELSRTCPKEYESKLMEVAGILQKMDLK
jgi:hypothetical protein